MTSWNNDDHCAAPAPRRLLPGSPGMENARLLEATCSPKRNAASSIAVSFPMKMLPPPAFDTTGLLADLAHLVEVDLSGNALEADTILRYHFTHPHLRVGRILHDNQLAGTIPETIPDNTALQYLSRRENNILSSIPSQIQHLAALTHLDLEGNALTGTLPAEQLSQRTRLSYLFLGKNPIESAPLPDQLRSLKSLRELSLDGLQSTGPIPAWIENFSNLRLLDLRTNAVTGTIDMIDFRNPQQWTYLLLSSNLLTDPIPETLEASSSSLDGTNTTSSTTTSTTTQSSWRVVALHQNGFMGENGGGLCRRGADDDDEDTASSSSSPTMLPLLTTDCGAVTCSCCTDCCDSEDCYGDVDFVSPRFRLFVL